MKKVIYLGYENFPFGMSHRVIKAFSSEQKAKEWMQQENAKVADTQEYDDWGLVEGSEFNYFEMELE